MAKLVLMAYLERKGQGQYKDEENQTPKLEKTRRKERDHESVQ